MSLFAEDKARFTFARMLLGEEWHALKALQNVFTLAEPFPAVEYFKVHLAAAKLPSYVDGDEFTRYFAHQIFAKHLEERIYKGLEQHASDSAIMEVAVAEQSDGAGIDRGGASLARYRRVASEACARHPKAGLKANDLDPSLIRGQLWAAFQEQTSRGLRHLVRRDQAPEEWERLLAPGLAGGKSYLRDRRQLRPSKGVTRYARLIVLNCITADLIGTIRDLENGRGVEETKARKNDWIRNFKATSCTP